MSKDYSIGTDLTGNVIAEDFVSIGDSSVLQGRADARAGTNLGKLLDRAGVVGEVRAKELERLIREDELDAAATRGGIPVPEAPGVKVMPMSTESIGKRVVAKKAVGVIGSGIVY